MIRGARAEGLKINVLILSNHAVREPHQERVARGDAGERNRIASYNQEAAEFGKGPARCC